MPYRGDAREGFRGIDPRGLFDLARLVSTRAAELERAATQVGAVSSAVGVPVRESADRRLRATAQQLLVCAADLERRAAAIQRIDEVAAGVLSAVLESIRSTAVSRLRPQCHGSSIRNDLARAYRCVDGLLLGRSGETDVRQSALVEVVAQLEPGDLARMADMLMAAGHDARAITLLGAAAGTLPPQSVLRTLDALEQRLESEDFVASLLAGSLLAAIPGGTYVLAARWIATHLGLAAHVLRGAAVGAAVDGGLSDAPTAVIEILASVDDVGRIADMVVALVRRFDEPLPGLDPGQLDRAIAALIEVDPRAVVSRLATVADPHGRAVVPWFQHLISADDGPTYVGSLLDSVIGHPRVDAAWLSDPGRLGAFENAETAAYLAACLSVAVVREARDAQHDVGTIASAAATAEILIPAVRGITKALEVAIPVGLSFGVGIAADNADRRIEGAMTALLERIAERFEVPADAAPERLAHALDVFDERRDRLVQHWEDRP